MKSRKLRIFLGFISAFAVSDLITFISGCFYAAILGGKDSLNFIKAAILGTKDALDIILFIAGYAITVATPIALFVILFMGVPLFLISRKLQLNSLRYYIVSGAIISLTVVIIVTLQQLTDYSLVEKDFYFLIVSMVIVGPMATLTFWTIVRPDRF